jgi:hypothetical protein
MGTSKNSRSFPVSITGVEQVFPPFSIASVIAEIQGPSDMPLGKLCFMPATPKDGLTVYSSRINIGTWPFIEIPIENTLGKPQHLRVGLLVGIVTVSENPSSQGDAILAIDEVHEGELQEIVSDDGEKILRWTPPNCRREEFDPVEYFDSPTLTFPLIPLRPRHSLSSAPSPILWKFPELQPGQAEDVEQLLTLHRDVFAAEDDPLGYCNRLEFRIDTGDALPARQRAYRVAPSQETLIREGVNELLQRRLIRESNSDYGAPVVMVPKKDGRYRFCVSYKKLNEQLKDPAWPMPHLFDALTRLGRSRYFSTLDMKSGYHQIKVADADQHKTAFVTPWACYEFLVVPFGIKTAPSHFMKVMELVLRGLPNVIAYLDDILVHSTTFEEHLNHLAAVFDRLRTANLKLHPGKCVFAQQRCKFLGHIISSEGITPNPEKVRAIADFPRPTDVKKVRQFLGVTSFFRRHIPDYAKKARDLHQLLKKEQPFIWTAKTEDSFVALKQTLLHAPVLKSPDFTREFIITTDASSFALGAVLTQQFPNQNGTVDEFPIAFASRALRPNELNYTVSEKELLAVMFAIQQFDCYVQSKHFTIRCDHRPLQFILSNKTSKNARLERWSILLQAYNFTTEYREGRSIAHADGLSRNPPVPRETVAQTPEKVVCGIIDELDSAATLLPNPEDIPEYIPLLDVITLREEQRKDVFCQLYLTYFDRVTRGVPNHAVPPEAEKFHLSPNEVLLKEVRVQAGPSIRTCYAVVIPDRLRHHVMMSYHHTPWSGHQGTEKTFRKMVPRVYWPGMQRDIKSFCQSCPSCQKIKINSSKRPNPMTIPRLPSQPFEIVAIDIVGPLPPSRHGNRYLLTVLDHLTRFCEAIPIRTQTAEEVGRVFVDQIICRFGTPKCLISDRGGNFTSKLFRQICSELKIRRVLTSAYHPQSNGALERTHRTIKNSLTAYVHKDQRRWDEYIPKIIYAYNSAPHSATGFSPGYLLFGRELELPLDHLASMDTIQENKSPDTWPEDLQKMRHVSQWVRRRLTLQAEKRKQYYDTSRKVTPHGFQSGDFVLIKRQSPFPSGETPKLGLRFLGPFRVRKIYPPSTLEIEDPQRPETKRTVHADKAVLYKTPPTFPNLLTTDTNTGKPEIQEEIPGKKLYDSTGVMDLSQYSPTAFPDELPDIPLDPQPLLLERPYPSLEDSLLSPLLPTPSAPMPGGLAHSSCPPSSSSMQAASLPPSYIPRPSRWKKALYPPASRQWRRQLFTDPSHESRTSTPITSPTIPIPGDLRHDHATRARGPVPDYPLPERWRQPKRKQPPSSAPRATAEQPPASIPPAAGSTRDPSAESPFTVSYHETPWEEDISLDFVDSDYWWDDSQDDDVCQW